MNPEDKELLDEYQALLTTVVFKFSNSYHNKRDLYFYCRDVNLHYRGICTSDLYQFGEIILIETIKKIKNKDIQNISAYLFTAVYRQLRYLVNKQDGFVEFDSSCEEKQKLQISPTVESEYDYRELKKILYSIIEQLDNRRKYVLESLYGLNEKEIKSQAQLGRELGISYQMVASLRDSSFRKIKKNKKSLINLRVFLD